MRSFLKVGVTLVIFLGAILWVVRNFDAQKESHAYELAREELRSEFLARAPWVFGIEDPSIYPQEVRGLFRWYHQRVEEIAERFPELSPPVDAYLAQLEERYEAGRLREPEYEGFKESYEQVAEIWGAIAGGSYAPAMTGTSGPFRLDFFEARPTLVHGQRAIQGRFVLWGAQRSRVEEESGGMGELTFGLPAGSYVPVPEQRIETFPPLAFVGDYIIPLVPHEAETMEMKATVISRATTGTEIRGEFVWNQPVPAHWKLAEGEAWEGARIGHRDE